MVASRCCHILAFATSVVAMPPRQNFSVVPCRCIVCLSTKGHGLQGHGRQCMGRARKSPLTLQMTKLRIAFQSAIPGRGAPPRVVLLRRCFDYCVAGASFANCR